MGTIRTLPQPLLQACTSSHPLELWILVNGEIVQCAGSFLPADEKGRLQITASLPEGFVGVMRSGAAVRGFFTDPTGAVHTFLTSIQEWLPYKDRPTAARVRLEAPSLVAPCQRRRGERHAAKELVARLSVQIRGERASVSGRVVDISPSGLGVRVIRTGRNWFSEGTRVEVEIDLPGRSQPVSFPATIARVEEEALHYLHGLRVEGSSQGRRALADVIEHLL
ncbi:MAG TPA: PilZ domain-containing protein [Planctomycetota bacterium]|nr:PilZ domain-containing protein [Planctomycetota bacterium]